MKRKTETIRKSAPYERWQEIADFFEKEPEPEVPEILRYLYTYLGVLNIGDHSGAAIEQLIRDRYSGFAMIERLK